MALTVPLHYASLTAHDLEGVDGTRASYDR
jgi:hypothetical protein